MITLNQKIPVFSGKTADDRIFHFKEYLGLC